ncbi:MAG: hypothetical protein AB7O98_04900 [Hyphomonadaceae bacterium]
MRALALEFLIEHWRFFLGALVFGLVAWGGLRLILTAAAARRAKEDAARSRELDAEMARIRENLGR